MREDKNKGAIIAIIAVLIVCGGSFFAVKALSNRNSTQVDTSAPMQTVIQTFYQIVTDATSAPAAPATVTPVTSETTTMPTTTAPTTEITTETTTAFTTMTPLITSPTGTPGDVTTATPYVTEALTAATQAPAVTQAPATTQQTAVTDSNISSAASQNEGFLSYIFDPSGHFYYTAGDPWQRNFGFNPVYDDLAGFVFIYYDTVRIKFTYDSKDWMIQFWKGQYGGVFIGAEIGVYNKPTSRVAEHYDCASNEDCLYMSMTCQRNGEEIFSREYASYWWCTGFVPGRLKSFRDRSELCVRARITAKDNTMLKGFVAGLNNAGFVYKSNYYVDGLDMYIVW